MKNVDATTVCDEINSIMVLLWYYPDMLQDSFLLWWYRNYMPLLSGLFHTVRSLYNYFLKLGAVFQILTVCGYEDN